MHGPFFASHACFHIAMPFRKFFICFIPAAALVVLAGCGQDNDAPQPVPETPAAETTPAAPGNANEAVTANPEAPDSVDAVDAAVQGSVENRDQAPSETAFDVARSATDAAAEVVQAAGQVADRASKAADEVSGSAADEVAATAERADAALKAGQSDAREAVADTASRASDAVSNTGIGVSGDARTDAPIQSGGATPSPDRAAPGAGTTD